MVGAPTVGVSDNGSTICGVEVGVGVVVETRA
jgi:hypothetical protein